MLFKLWNALLCSFLSVLFLGRSFTFDTKGKSSSSGVIFSNAEVERQCEVDAHGRETCGMQFSLDDFDHDSTDEDDEFSDDGDLDDESEMEEGCKDTHELCYFWASQGECENNPGYMLTGCPRSCRQCGGEEVREMIDHLEEKPIKILDEQKMLIESSMRFGVEQEVSGEQSVDTLLVIRKSLSYMDHFVHAEKPTHVMSSKIIKVCENKESLCSFWAACGECEANVAFMLTNCAPACQSCHKIDFDTRCPPRDPNEKPAWQSGDLHRMFHNIVTQTTYPDVTIYSRSDQPISAENSKQMDKLYDPWILTIDNFLTDEECDEIIQLGYNEGYKRSQDISNDKNDDGSFKGYKNDRRTSKNAWCSNRNNCREKPVIQRVHDRIEQITQISALNSEDFQILKYEEGEFYREHHDFIEHQVDRACGPRILTVFLYLSDVEEGGGTRFPSLNHTVNPKKGRVLLWPSVMNSNPILPDRRMRHEALPVIKGRKFAANAWIHLYDNVTPTQNGCA